MQPMPNFDDQTMGIFLVVMLFALAIGLTIAIFFYLTLSRCLSRIQPHNREMEPGLVWLNLIPCVGTIWIFVTVIRITNSLRREYEDRGWRTEGETFGNGVGMGLAICSLLGAIPYIGGLFGLIAFICMIVYWVQISNYSARLVEPYQGGGGRYDDERGLPQREPGGWGSQPDDPYREPDDRYREPNDRYRG
jgi:hypothetical protein